MTGMRRAAERSKWKWRTERNEAYRLSYNGCFDVRDGSKQLAAAVVLPDMGIYKYILDDI